jgi:PEP-CTERM/exosortase A-associated glycosyltransferase
MDLTNSKNAVPCLKDGASKVIEESSSAFSTLDSASLEKPTPQARTRAEFTSNQSRLKILHVLDHSLPLHSGYTFRTQSILQEQRRKGWMPVAVTSPKHEASWKQSSGEREEIDGFRFYRTGALRKGSVTFSAELRLMRALAKRIEEIARMERPNLLHAHSPVLNVLPALWAGRKLGVPVVYEIRAFWEDAAVDHRTYSQNSWRYGLVRFLETWACKKAAQVAVLCEGLKRDLVERSIPEEKLTVVANGIDPKDFHPCEPDAEFAKALGIYGRKVLGFIGSFYHYEGLELLIAAIAKLSAMRSDLVLLLVGGGEQESELRAQIREMKLQDRVAFLGRIPHEKIPSLYSLIDILVYPRYSMRLTELVTPLKPLEAMAMGKPVVASDIGGHRELIRAGSTGLLFKPGDVSSLVEAVQRLLNDAGLCNQLATQANQWVGENRTWGKTTSIYSSIYAKALAQNLI